MREREWRSRPHVKRLRKEMTRAEIIVWARLKALRSEGYRFRRQHPIDDFIVDFANLENRLAIEIDGATHSEDHEVSYDTARTKGLEALGWAVVRVSNTDVYESPESVLEEILSRLPHPSAARTPPPQAGEEGDQADQNALNNTHNHSQGKEIQ